MIIQQLTNPDPQEPSKGLAIKRQSLTLPSIAAIASNDVVYCALECGYVEPVFALPDAEWWKNDKSSFLFQKLIAADSISLKLAKNGTAIATLTDNTFGTLYNGFDAQPLYVGFVLEWEKVYAEYGGGEYQLLADKTILGATTTYTSRTFNLQRYDDYAANGSVRIETYNTGNILSSDFNYTDLLPEGWYNSYRIKGRFGAKTPTLVSDNYLDQNYNLKQIIDKIEYTYTLQTETVSAEISNMLVEDSVLANEVLITDYNVYNQEVYRRVAVYPKEISDKKDYGRTRKTVITIKFSDKRQNIIKNN